ncbi:hypothetical protein KIPB_010081, partial [Kipferlia bialata]
ASGCAKAVAAPAPVVPVQSEAASLPELELSDVSDVSDVSVNQVDPMTIPPLLQTLGKPTADVAKKVERYLRKGEATFNLEKLRTGTRAEEFTISLTEVKGHKTKFLRRKQVFAFPYGSDFVLDPMLMDPKRFRVTAFQGNSVTLSCKEADKSLLLHTLVAFMGKWNEDMATQTQPASTPVTTGTVGAQMERVEPERLEAERVEAEPERLEAERVEAEAERLETERVEAEAERLEAGRREAGRREPGRFWTSAMAEPQSFSERLKESHKAERAKAAVAMAEKKKERERIAVRRRKERVAAEEERQRQKAERAQADARARQYRTTGVDYYQCLGVHQTASQEQIKKAHKRLALKLHPDRNTNTDTTEDFKRLQTANDVLGDVRERRAYDRSRM